MEDHVMDSERGDIPWEEYRYRILSREEILGQIEKGETVADMGSGTGFFTDDMAEKAGKVYGIDFQEDMHQYYQQKGMPENVDSITSKASNIEIKDPDKVFSIPLLHEIYLEKTLQKLSDALKEYRKIFIVDWSKNAETEKHPSKR